MYLNHTAQFKLNYRNKKCECINKVVTELLKLGEFTLSNNSFWELTAWRACYNLSNLLLIYFSLRFWDLVDGRLVCVLNRSLTRRIPISNCCISWSWTGATWCCSLISLAFCHKVNKKITDSPIEVKCETVKISILQLGTEEDQDTRLMYAQSPEHSKTNLKLKLTAIYRVYFFIFTTLPLPL